MPHCSSESPDKPLCVYCFNELLEIYRLYYIAFSALPVPLGYILIFIGSSQDYEGRAPELLSALICLSTSSPLFGQLLEIRMVGLTPLCFNYIP
jgi:uncharacterized membrane protein YGL010W